MSPARMAAKTSAGSSSSGGTSRGGVTGVHGACAELRDVEVGDPVQRREIEHPGDLVAVLGLETEAAQQEVAGRGRHRPFDLEAHGLAEAPTAKLLLDGHQKVVGFVLLDREVGVAGDPEQVGVDDLHAGEQVLEVRFDDLLDQDELLRVGLEQPRQDLRHLHAREDALVRLQDRAARPRSTC